MVELDEHLGIEHNFCISCDIQFETANKLAQHDTAEHNISDPACNNLMAMLTFTAESSANLANMPGSAMFRLVTTAALPLRTAFIILALTFFAFTVDIRAYIA
ncbi:hypothetical protein PENANT_c146G11180 [Penicillium antarcticum]|uniref:C2H2-type domain-containing protein n=1 Tax=Penicillium antarcticum TaxID=416450 RepID=A0A1V6PFR7_9EURO|nr:hypothetical protein PENANT_c146G11180 [Penicillium antarcticum]